MVEEKKDLPPTFGEEDYDEGQIINVSGHVQELDRSFGLWSICAIGIVSDNAWGAGGGALVVALYNGGGPGVLYGLIAATFFYALIGASLAELASALPSSANVYHWAAVTPGPRFGRVCSFFAGWWNCFSWIFGCALSCLFSAEAIIAMYSLYHPDYEPQRWQIFIAYLGICWLSTALVLFGQRVLAKVATAFGILCIVLCLITILICAIYPSYRDGYASNAFVWTEWNNLTGWSSNGFVFLMGMLNGAYAIGTPDGVCHLGEEIPNPRVNVPKGIVAQLSIGFVTTFAFYIAILYGVTSLEDVFASNITALPLAAMYQQATGYSRPATVALLFIFLLDVIVTVPGAWITASRMLWTLARDRATPFPHFVRKVSPHWRNPFNAQIICACIVSILGAIYIGSAVAFNAFIGSFTIFTTLSYLAAFLPHILTGRRYMKPGVFWMPDIVAYIVTGTASAYIIVFNVIYMFPYSLPVSYLNMNWECVMCGGITILLIFWYIYKIHDGYIGPQVAQDASSDVKTVFIGLDEEVTERRRSSIVRPAT